MEETVVTSGGQPTRPFYLLTSTKIGLPVFGTSQNELVNKVHVLYAFKGYTHVDDMRDI